MHYSEERKRIGQAEPSKNVLRMFRGNRGAANSEVVFAQLRETSRYVHVSETRETLHAMASLKFEIRNHTNVF